MKTEEVKAVLTHRWPDEKYLHIYEAPIRADRTGTAIDVLVVGLWRSLGFEFDAVEVKVSYADWCREWKYTEWTATSGSTVKTFDRKPQKRDLQSLDDAIIEKSVRVNTSKNWEWRDRAHRFWIAAPLELAQRIVEDIRNNPELEGWGVIGVTDKTKILLKPKENKPKPLTHQQWIGLLRAGADSGVGALERAYNKGRVEARRQAEVHSPHYDLGYMGDPIKRFLGE